MFTGIIEELGKVKDIARKGAIIRLSIQAVKCLVHRQIKFYESDGAPRGCGETVPHVWGVLSPTARRAPKGGLPP